VRESLRDFRYNALTLHNHYRRLHGACELRLSETLNTLAQQVADNLKNYSKLAHSGIKLNQDEPLGENLASIYHSGGTIITG
jgi:uncharacterized protein YkwD